MKYFAISYSDSCNKALYMCMDVHTLFCTLALTFWGFASQCTPSHTSTKLNLLVQQSGIIQGNLIVYLFELGYLQMSPDALLQTYCQAQNHAIILQNLFFKSQNVIANSFYGIIITLPDIISKTQSFLVTVAWCQKLLAIQEVRMTYIGDYRRYQYSRN